jgi:polyisoprenoid-binding protein YceI
MSVVTADSHNGSIPSSQDGLATRTEWHIDPVASRVEFTIRKRMFLVPLRVTGRFTDVQGTISLDEQDPITAEASITIAATSIDTANARRDTHLRAADFFHVDTSRNHLPQPPRRAERPRSQPVPGGWRSHHSRQHP